MMNAEAEGRASQGEEETIDELISQVKRLAKKYYRLTGRPLGVTGENAEYKAVCKIRSKAHSDSGVRRTPIPGHAAH